MYNYVGGGTGTTERGRGCVVALLQGSAPLSGCSPGLQGSSLTHSNLPSLTWCYQDLILLRPAAPTHTTRQYYLIIRFNNTWSWQNWVRCRGQCSWSWSGPAWWGRRWGRCIVRWALDPASSWRRSPRRWPRWCPAPPPAGLAASASPPARDSIQTSFYYYVYPFLLLSMLYLVFVLSSAWHSLKQDMLVMVVLLWKMEQPAGNATTPELTETVQQTRCLLTSAVNILLRS